MGGKIGRNEPCPCNSGEKYKNCCGKNLAVVSIKELMEQDLTSLQVEIIEFAKTFYSEEIEEDFHFFVHFHEISEEEELEFYEFVHTFYFVCFEPLDDEETILQKFIASHSHVIARPRIKEILKSWMDAKPIAGVITKLKDNQMILQDTLRNTNYTVFMKDLNDYTVGSFGFGILLPYEDEYLLFPGFFDLPKEETTEYENNLRNEYAASGYENDEEFLHDNFLDMMLVTPTTTEQLNVSSFEWPNAGTEKVAQIFEEEMKEALEEPHVIELGLILWSIFVHKKEKRIQKPSLYVAALRYLLCTLVPTRCIFTQKEIGELYGVPANSISGKYSEIYFELEDEIGDILEDQMHLDSEPSPPIISDEEMLEVFNELKDRQFDSMEEFMAYIGSKGKKE